MINEVVAFIKSKLMFSVKILRNYRLYIILLISFVTTYLISNTEMPIELFQMFPTCIGVLLGGLMTTVAIIFGVIRDEDLKQLYEKYGDKFSDSLTRLKYHILSILFILFGSILSFFINSPAFLLWLSKKATIPEIQIFYFVQIFLAYLTLYLTIEVVNVFFLIFEIKFQMIIKSNRRKT